MADAKVIVDGSALSGNTTAIPDNQVALKISSTDAKDYITIDTTDGSEKITLTNATETIGAISTAITGTFTATQGSDVINAGSSTAFKTELHVGSAIKIPSDVAAGFEIFTVDGITSDTILSLDSNYLGSTRATSGGAFTDGGELFAVKTGDSKLILSVNATGVLGLSTTPDATSSSSNLLGIGDPSMFDNVTTSIKSTVIGNCRSHRAWSLTTADSTTLIGYEAGRNLTTGDRTIAIGTTALDTANSTNDAVVIGVEAGQSSGHNSVYIGAFTGKACTGADNVGIGYIALDASGTHANCVAVGSGALSAVTTSGNGNIGIGKNAGLSIESGHSNICIGSSSNAQTTLNNQIAIGADATTTAANQIMMGNHRTTDMTMDAPPITVKQTATSGAGISLEHNASTAVIAHIGEDGNAGWFQLRKSASTDAEVKFVCTGSSFIGKDTSRNFGVGNATPTSTFHNFGETALELGNVSSSAAADASTRTTALVDTTSGDITTTLPAVASCVSRVYIFKKKVEANDMIIATNASETIDGASSLTFASQYDCVGIQSNGTEWNVLWKYEP